MQKYVTIDAISSGRPSRWTMCASALAGRISWSDVGQDRGVDGAGRDGVDEHVVRGVLERRLLGERRDAALGRRVGGEVGQAAQRGERGDVDDATAAVLNRRGSPRACPSQAPLRSVAMTSSQASSVRSTTVSGECRLTTPATLARRSTHRTRRPRPRRGRARRPRAHVDPHRAARSPSASICFTVPPLSWTSRTRRAPSGRVAGRVRGVRCPGRRWSRARRSGEGRGARSGRGRGHGYLCVRGHDVTSRPRPRPVEQGRPAAVVDRHNVRPGVLRRRGIDPAARGFGRRPGGQQRLQGAGPCR